MLAFHARRAKVNRIIAGTSMMCYTQACLTAHDARQSGEATYVTLTWQVRLRPSARAQAMVAASHRPVVVWIALSVRALMGSIMRWKSSHRSAMPSTVVDCRANHKAVSMCTSCEMGWQGSCMAGNH